MDRKSKPPKRRAARSILGENLRALRARRNLSQLELAELAGITQGYISSIEQESRAVSIDVVDELAKAFGVPVADLLKDDAG